MLRERQARLHAQWKMEHQEGIVANELMELRSQNIRSLLAARSKGWSPTSNIKGYQSQTSKTAPRIGQLEAKLAEFRSTYAYSGYSRPTSAPAPAQAPAGPRKVPLRGGWPVDESFRLDA